jgi:peptide/nickel transport system substrate-binding protein
MSRAQPYPIGCGPFRFVRWERDQVTEVKRFEEYFETDAAGNNLPYLDGILGQPRDVEQIRFMRLRSGQADLIETATYIDARTYIEYYAEQFQLWNVPTLGTSYVLFNLNSGPFVDKRLRQAAAHAIDHETLKRVVFYSRGETARGFYASISPWYALGKRPWPAYDPERARFILRRAKAVGVTVLLQSLRSSPYMQQTAALIQGMWSEVGFKVVHKMHEASVLTQKRRAGAFHAESTAASYRFDPDGWFSRHLLSTAMSTQASSGFRHQQVDRLIHEARGTPDKQQRLQLYAEIDSIVNEELPILYLHHLTSFEMGVMQLKGYQPSISGLFSTRGAGVRTAWLA